MTGVLPRQARVSVHVNVASTSHIPSHPVGAELRKSRDIGPEGERRHFYEIVKFGLGSLGAEGKYRQTDRRNICSFDANALWR